MPDFKGTRDITKQRGFFCIFHRFLAWLNQLRCTARPSLKKIGFLSHNQDFLGWVGRKVIYFFFFFWEWVNMHVLGFFYELNKKHMWMLAHIKVSFVY